MNRRGFFNKLGKIAAAVSASPLIFIPKFEPVRWKVNPLWQEAQYECFFVDEPPCFDERILTDGDSFVFGNWGLITTRYRWNGSIWEKQEEIQYPASIQSLAAEKPINITNDPRRICLHT